MDIAEKERKKRLFVADIRRHLKKFNAYETIDKHALNRMADWHVEYLEAKNNVDEFGSTQVTKTGYTTMTGYFQSMVAAERMLQALYTKYGIDTITRDKLKFESKKKETQNDGLIK